MASGFLNDVSSFVSGGLEWAGGLIRQAVSWTAGKAKGAALELVETGNKYMPNMLPSATAALAELNFRGSQGNFVSTIYPVVLKCEFFRTATPLPQRYGYPCNEFKALGGLNGFVLCKDAQVNISGTIDEEEVIEAFLNNGVFLDWAHVPPT